MKKTLRYAAAKGFTLIELLIVVIIIAILAAIAIPQFANTTGDAQEGALEANLSTMRSAVELYRVQHRGAYPSAVTSVPDAAGGTAASCTAASGVAGNAAINTPEAFTQQLTNFSNATGATCTVSPPDGSFSLGPYLRAIPQETISNPPSANVVITSPNVFVPPAAVVPGWAFNNNPRVGRFVVNSNAVGRRGAALSTY